jgi:hypothetical protein
MWTGPQPPVHRLFFRPVVCGPFRTIKFLHYAFTRLVNSHGSTATPVRTDCCPLAGANCARMVCLACCCNRGSRLAFRLRNNQRQQRSIAVSTGDAVRQPSQCKLRFRCGRFHHDSKRNIIEHQLGFGDHYTSDRFQQLLQRFGHGLPHDSSRWPERTGSSSVCAPTGRQRKRDIVSRK